ALTDAGQQRPDLAITRLYRIFARPARKKFKSNARAVVRPYRTVPSRRGRPGSSRTRSAWRTLSGGVRPFAPEHRAKRLALLGGDPPRQCEIVDIRDALA